MYGEQDHAKVNPYKIIYIFKIGKKINRTISKETFTTCKKWNKRKIVQKQYQSEISIKQVETQSIRKILWKANITAQTKEKHYIKKKAHLYTKFNITTQTTLRLQRK